MRILIVSQYFHPEPFRINDAARWLVQQGHQVSVLTGQPNYPSGKHYPGHGWLRPVRSTFGQVTIHRVPILPRGRGGAVSLAMNYLSFVVSASLLGPFLARGRFDAIICFVLSPVTAALPAILLRGIKERPLALWVQDLWPESVSAAGGLRSRPALAALHRLVDFIYGRAEVFWVPSRAFAPAITRYGIPQSRIVYLPNSAEDFYNSPTASQSRNAPAETFSIAYAGNMGEAQGLELVLEAAAQIPPSHRIHWILIGDGRRREWLVEQVKIRNLGQVSIRDRLPPERMPEVLAEADALLVSLRDDPLFALTVPSKLQSSLASGKPILAVLAGAGASIVEEAGAGLVVTPGNSAALAQAAICLAGLPIERRREMGAAGREYYLKHFDRELVYGRLEEELKRLCARGRRQGREQPDQG
jgi:colanic acid biosynthesis glycosyl transferase WcaI